MKIVTENMNHPTVDFIFEHLRQEIPNVSLATVYRNLNQLTDSGNLKKLTAYDGTTRFDHNTHNHYHFICIQCNKVYDVPCDVAADLDQKVAEVTGLKVLNHEISFQGICHECQKQKTN